MRILYLGDIHCNFNLLVQYVKFYKIKNAHIVQVGDFGVGFYGFENELKTLQMVNKFLKVNNVIVHAIRGNHDYKPYFDNDPFNLSNIKLIKDYTILELEDRKILCMGGAVSVDRMYTMNPSQKAGDFTYRPGQRWFNDEEFILDDDFLKTVRGVNTIVTHTAPDYCPPDNSYGFGAFVDGFIETDPDLRLDLMDERRKMSIAFQTVKMNNDIEYAYYGHFHRSDTLNFLGTVHRVLGVGELYEERV